MKNIEQNNQYIQEQIEAPGENADYINNRMCKIMYDRDPRHGPRIDLGLATNPSGPAVEAALIHDRIQTSEMAEYDEDVHHEVIKTLLIDGIGLTGIDHACVILNSNGSYGAGDEAIRALTRYLSDTDHAPTILVPNYSFPNVAQYALRHGMDYAPIPNESLSPTDSLRRVLSMTENELSGNVLYVDYPNNPYGVADPDLLRQVIDHTVAQGGIPLIDLAFGEVLGDEYRDAIQYTIDHGGIALGSITKTQGLPGLRAGYVIMGKELSERLYDGGTRLVFGLPPEAKAAYELLYEKTEDGLTRAAVQASAAAEYNYATNTKLYAALETMGLSIGETNMCTPIQTVIARIPDLYKRLAVAGVLSESLDDYKKSLTHPDDGYGMRAVRILTPRHGQLENAIERIQLALNLPQIEVNEVYDTWVKEYTNEQLKGGE